MPPLPQLLCQAARPLQPILNWACSLKQAGGRLLACCAREGCAPPSPLPSDSMCRACMVGLHVSQLLLMLVDMLTLMDSSAGVGP